MVGPQYDLVGNPLGAVRSTFERAAAESGGHEPVAAFRGKDWGATEVFRSFLFEQGGLDKVRSLIPPPRVDGCRSCRFLKMMLFGRSLKP